MTQLTKNIWRHELACKCGCGFDSMDFETINVVQECCDYFALVQGKDKVTLNINSAARCYEYNRSIGSNDQSQHPKARAIDFAIDGIDPSDVYTYLDERWRDLYGIGSYNSFTHVDTRTGRARWQSLKG